MITAAGRQELHKYMKMLGRRLLYGDFVLNLYVLFNMQFFFPVDTDSVWFLSSVGETGKLEIPTGPGLGITIF